MDRLTCLLLVILGIMVLARADSTTTKPDCLLLPINSSCDLSTILWPVLSCYDPTVYFDCIQKTNQSKFHVTTFKLDQLKDIHGHQVSEISQRTKRQNGQIGSSCFYNTDCVSGMYCNAGRCICLANNIQKDNFCYEKVNPGQSGCVYNEQCSGVWARATCVNGVCTCPSVPAVLSGPLTPVHTKDGVVCAADSYCPLPIDDGVITVLEPSVAMCISSTDCAKATTFTAPGAETIGELYECSAISACCPNRAYTCSMSMGGPPSGGNGWWYNIAIGQCQQIVTTNNRAAINANNFASKEHCQSYCGSICPRGNPQYTNDRPSTCTSTPSSIACANNYQCTSLGSQQRCCPKPNFICSRNGGMATSAPTQITEYNTGFQGSSFSPQTATTRYYYDSQTRQCMTFAYLGSGGNFNNFLTQAECQTFCIQQALCTKGAPLTDPNGQVQRCTIGVPCPVTHSCTNSVCCPTRQTICAQVQQQGTCTQYVQRFWYNSMSKQCQQFTYSGCQGNDNNFATVLECQTFCKATIPEPQCPQGKALRDTSGNFLICSSNIGVFTQCPTNHECHFDGNLFGCCPTKAYTCSLAPNFGISCGPSSVRWSFDARTQTCTSFTYLGCDGNSNNFPSREQCEKYCALPACPNGGQPLTDPSSARVHICSSSFQCPSTHECTLFTTSSTSVSYCCPTRASTCSQSADGGQICPGMVSPITLPYNIRYYFSPISKTCQTFTYQGCGGNGNNFQTHNQCLSYCNSAACPSGQVAYVSPSTQSILTCADLLSGICPIGFTCVKDALWQRSICCGATDMGVCPPNERAYMEALTLEAKICLPNLANACPSSYICRFSEKKNRYYCCAPSPASDICGLNSTAYETSPGSASKCDPNGETCPIGYVCQLHAPAHTHYCCKSAFNDKLSALCPNGGNAIDRNCSPHLSSNCPIGHSCLFITSNARYQCCTVPGNFSEMGICLDNQLPFIDPVTGKAKLCGTYTLAGQCPLGYSCLASTSNVYICCPTPHINTTPTCPTSMQLFVSPQNRYQPCQNDLCPSGSTCTGFINGKRYCCTVGSVPLRCPPSRRQFINPHPNQNPTSSITQTCQSSDACPNGYSCYLPADTQSGLCCPKMDTSTSVYACANGGRAFLYPPTQSPLACTPLEDRCPMGYSCQRALNRQFYCCRTSTATRVTSACPSGMKPLLLTKRRSLDSQRIKIQECIPSVYSCPYPYQCVPAAISGRFQCCAPSINSQWDLTKGRGIGYKRNTYCPLQYITASGECLLERYRKRLMGRL